MAYAESQGREAPEGECILYAIQPDIASVCGLGASVLDFQGFVEAI